MSSLFRFFTRLLLVLLVLLVIAAIAIPVFLDPNDYKAQIVSQLRESTGRDVGIDGDLELSLFPWLGLETGAVAVGNAAGFGDGPLATVASSQVSVKVLPLLNGRVEIGVIVLKGMHLNLARNAAGVGNWEGLATSADKSPAATGPAGEASAGGGESSGDATPMEFRIGGVEIEDAVLNWSDATSGQKLSLNDLDLSSGAVLPGQPLDLHLSMGINSTTAAISGKLKLAARVLLDSGLVRMDDMKLVLKLSGSGVPGGKLDADLKASAILDNKAQLLQLKGLVLTLDESRFDGDLKLTGFEKPAVEFALKLDQIDLDRYTAASSSAADSSPAAATTASPASATSGSGGVAAVTEKTASPGLPLKALRGLNLNGSLAIGKLKVSNLRVQDVVVKVVAKDGVIQLAPATLALYSGTFSGSVRADARTDTLKAGLKLKLDGVQLGPLLADLNGEQSLSGTTRLDADLQLAGNGAEAMKRSLGGRAALELNDGSYQGIDLVYELRRAKALIKGKPIPASGRAATDFAAMSGRFVIHHGLLSSKDLSVKSPVLRVKGGGSINLPQNTLELGLDVKITGSLEGQGGKGLDDLKGVEIPVTLSGPLADPKVGVDLEKLLKGELGRQLQKQLDKKLGGLLGTGSQDGGGDQQQSGGSNDSLKKAVPGLLKGLFN